MSDGLVLIERRGAVMVLTLNRPDRLNAWTDALEAEYFEALDVADDDPDVRVVVVTGAGRGFCAGADMDDLQSAEAADGSAFERVRPRDRPLQLRKPLIAAINGAAAGIGLVEALYCDIRFAAPKAKLTTAFVRRGLIAEYGISWLLPRIVGPSRAMDLLLSGRIVRAEQAHAWGLVDEIAEDVLEAAVAYAQDLAANCSPTSMAVIKQQVLHDLDVDFDTAFAASEQHLRDSFTRPDVEEGVRSYLDGREPAFSPLPARS